MTIAVILMGGLGLAVGICLAIASKVFYVYVDPKILAIEDALPGANCGGCGLPGCSANAEAIVSGKAAPNSCVAAGEDVALAIAAILGVSIEAKEPDVARPGCTYGVARADTKYDYLGISDCRAAAMLSGGMKVCTIGCMGLGSCAKACPFDAIHMGEDGLPVVDPVKCTGCGTCERVCPKTIITLSSVTRRILQEYTTDVCTTPCQRRCPAGINISEYIRHIAEGNPQRAVQVIKERNPFPTVIGRICPRPCEEDCRRQYVDEPVAINFLKRYAADAEMKSGVRVQPFCAPHTGRRIAVVGGGVEGLSAAFFSARLGHSVTVYEAADQPGGLLRTAISRYRLPQDILDWDIDGIRELGVEIVTRAPVGDGNSVADLLDDGCQAVFLATGGWDSRLARGALHRVDAPIPGVYLLVDAARSAVAGPMPRNVVIHGGGDLAISVARTCLEKGAAQVSVVFRESKEECGVAATEIDAAADEGIQIRFNASVAALKGVKQKLAAVDIADIRNGVTDTLDAQWVLFASGRLPEMVFVPVHDDPDTPDESAESTGEWIGLPPYKPTAFKDRVGLFSDGDPLTDFSGAIKAIAGGRRAAASIHRLLYNIGLELDDHVLTPDADIQNVHEVERVPATRRQIMPLCPQPDVAHCKEVELGFTDEMAKSEASRCLQCGLICYEHEQPAQAAPTAQDAA